MCNIISSNSDRGFYIETRELLNEIKLHFWMLFDILPRGDGLTAHHIFRYSSVERSRREIARCDASLRVIGGRAICIFISLASR